MSVNWLVMRQPQLQQGHIRRLSEHELRLAQENARLTEENRRLRVVCDDLAASSELWIRLYEAALARQSIDSRNTGNR
jgi:hypothetical protein